MTVIYLFLFLFYFMLMMGLIIGWRKSVQEIDMTNSHCEHFISVVIAARNEALSIGFLLKDLKNQHHNSFEVIVVDDHSTDRTFDVVSNQIEGDDRFKILSGYGIGKKEALQQGIKTAAGSIIVTTDADCRVGADWLRYINNYFQDDHIQLAFGGVRMIENNSIFSSMQAIEFCSLVGSGAATQALGFPTMCNGANLAFRKLAMEEVGGYADNIHIPSGDDEFLMRKIFDKYPHGIRFMSAVQTVVSTTPQATAGEFLQQRIRWAGKWKYHKDDSSKIVAVYIFLFHLVILGFIPIMLAGWISFKIIILLLSVKIILEFYFLYQVCRFLKIRWNYLAFILLQLLYPFYAVYVGFVAHFQPFTWKGRRLKSIKTKLDTIPDND